MEQQNQQQAQPEKQTPAKLYLAVKRVNPDNNKTGLTLLACEKIKAFKGLLPTEEILKTHFEAERVRMQIFERDHAGEENVKYIPQPLCLEFRGEQYDAIINEIRANLGKEVPTHLALTFGNGLPCCIVTRFNPEEYRVQEGVEEQPALKEE